MKTSILLMTAMVALAASGSARADIKIAVAGPLTGQYAAFGDQMKIGAAAAVQALNAAGGVLGQKLVMEEGDDACDPKQAVAVANQLVSKGVVAVFGHYCSGSSIPASAVYEEAGIVEISPASTNPKYTDDGKFNTFRTCGRDDQQGIVAGDYIAAHFKGKKVAILNDKSSYGLGLAQETQKRLKTLGIEPAMLESYTAGDRDYTALVTKMKQVGIDLIYLGGYHTEAGLILRQAREQGLQAKMMSGDALVTQEFWSIAGPAGEGMMMTFSPDPRKSPAAAKVVADFKARKIDPEGYVLYTYGAMQAWVQAVNKAGSTDGKKVAAALKANKAETVLGLIGFDAKGDVTAPGYVVYRWHEGSYDYAVD
ncbi:MAG TPA: branched-chain amino acid ABC transporter substrate-binding protein [Aliidongia sp.]|nr:branched-chain amino acid ABC transporter substrate-binding protein [Aliidongia sp.]